MSKPHETDDLGALANWGRTAVHASAKMPREALRFLGRQSRPRRGPPQGASPGEMVVPHDAPEPVIRVMRFEGDQLEDRVLGDVSELADVVAAPGTTWIDVVGFGNRATIEAIGETLDIHPLALADIVHVPQRPKAELYDGRLLVIAQMALVTDASEVDIEQVGLVLGPDWVASFQERPGDVFDPVRARVHLPVSRLRQSGADYVLYALLDAVIDGYFPVVEALGEVVEALEEEVIDRSSNASLARIHATRRALLALHRVQWRQRDTLGSLLRDEEVPISKAVQPYLRDAHDHAFQTLDAIETYRDLVVGLMDLHLSSASQRANDVMKTLTIVATIFIPLTFMTGVYGMNFEHIPELHWRWAYPAFWASMVAVGGGLMLWFKHRGWLER